MFIIYLILYYIYIYILCIKPFKLETLTTDYIKHFFIEEKILFFLKNMAYNDNNNTQISLKKIQEIITNSTKKKFFSLIKIVF